jgi:hypothetical protein
MPLFHGIDIASNAPATTNISEIANINGNFVRNWFTVKLTCLAMDEKTLSKS